MVVERLLRLVWPLDYYLLLLIHVGTNNTARGDLEYIESNYRALGTKVKDTSGILKPTWGVDAFCELTAGCMAGVAGSTLVFMTVGPSEE